jgi:tetratricopeptide (TPR) repeat protein
MDRPEEAAATYRDLEALDSAAAKSFAASGLIDLALYEGREQEALRTLDRAVAVDRATGATGSVGRRLAIVAGIRARRGERPVALRAARAAIAANREEGVMYLAGVAFADAGQASVARELAAELGNRLEQEPQIYARLLEGEAALAEKRTRDALLAFQEAQKLADTWLGRFGLGRTYLQASDFTSAYSEFELCLKRRGEATAVFLDDLPSYRLLAPVHYYLGRAQEGLGSPAAAESYKTFLAIKARGDERGLVDDARRRLGAR